MSKLLYDPSEYKRKLIEMLERKKPERKLSTDKQPIQSPKHKSPLRSATPHPSKSKYRSAFRDLENCTVFNNHRHDTTSTDVLEDHEHNKTLDVTVKTKHRRKKRAIALFDSSTDDDDYSSSLNSSKEVVLKKKKKYNKTKLDNSELKLSVNDLDDNPQASSSKLARRKATPHQKNYKCKLTTNNLGNSVLFITSNGDNYSPERNKDKKKCVRISNNNELVGRSNKKKKYENDKNECRQKILKHRATPYHSSEKSKPKPDNESSALLNRDLKHEFDDSDFEITPVESCDMQVSTSEISKSLTKEEAPKKQKLSRRKSTTAKSIDVSDIICDDKNEENLPDFSIMGNDSDVEYVNDIEALDITSNCSGAVVCSDINVSTGKGNVSSADEGIEYEKKIESTKLEPEETDSENSEENDSDEISSSPSDNEEGLHLNKDHDILTVEDTPIGKYQYISLNDALLLILHENTKLYFHGLMSITVLHGEVHIFGYTLKPSQENVELYSPRGSSFLFFETKSFTSPIRNDLLDILCKLQMERKDAKEFCKSLLPSSTVILCKKIVKTHIEFLQKHISQRLFPKCEYRMPQCVFQNVIGSWNVLKIPNKWDEYIDLMKPSTKTLLCGGKSVGKSTMLRYLINKLLMKNSEVLVIDLDPGQPEFTISGCISATVVKEPIFGPNYTHLKKPTWCLLLPDTNVAHKPGSYLTAVKELISLCNYYCKAPILINYMGFTRGIGLKIFATAVAHVQPSAIIEIYTETNKKRNFREIPLPQLIAKMSQFWASSVDVPPKFEAYRVESAADCSQGWHLEPQQIRAMCVLSYFGELLPEGVLSLTDTTVPVFAVNLSQVELMHNRDTVIPYVENTNFETQALCCVVNANLVALCSSSGVYSSPICHGWGVVRNVNRSKNGLYLLTPLSSELLQNANRLILSSVDLPPSLYATPDRNIGLVPYMCQGVLVASGKIPKRTTVPANITNPN